MKKATIVRTVLLLIVIINMILKASGKQIINVDESQVYEVVELLISLAIIIVSWWKNNSFTENAQKADEYLAELRRLEKEEREEGQGNG